MKPTQGRYGRRPAQRLPETRQAALFAAPRAAAAPAQGGRGAAEFFDPPPEAIFLGERPLGEYLEQVGQGWVRQLRVYLRQLDLSALTKAYQPSGRKPFHPALLLGLVLYGMLRRQWSLRDLERLAKLDAGAWWLCGGQQPDHSTIGDFLQRHAAVLSEEFFLTLTKDLLRRLHLGPGEAAGDGTVIEAVASHYHLLRVEAAREAAQQAQQAAQATPADRRAAAAAAQAMEVARVAAERQAAREETNQPTQVRVSPSEPEAVVQHLKNGASRPAYRPSILANAERLIVAQRLHPSEESTAVRPLLKQYQAVCGALPQRLLLDANYHNARVLGLALECNLDLLTPAGRADAGRWEQRDRQGKFAKHRFHYDGATDGYLCPAGERLLYVQQGKDHVGDYRRYGGANCSGCALRGQCTTAKAGGRTIKRYAADELKEAMSAVLADPRARHAYRRRKTMVEPPFAALRGGQGLTRFHRRGTAGAALEFALHCAAYNLRRAISLGSDRLLLVLFVWRAGQQVRLGLIVAHFEPTGRK